MRKPRESSYNLAKSCERDNLEVNAQNRESDKGTRENRERNK